MSNAASDARAFPWYGWLGAGTLVAGEAGVLYDALPIRMVFYCIAWWSYIALVDAWVWRRRGYSLLRSRPWEFCVLAFWSTSLWNLFELFNLRLQNWFYINAPAPPTVACALNLTAFATVLPAIFETYDLLESHGIPRQARLRPMRIPPVAPAVCVAIGLAMFAAALIWPRLAFPLIWGFAVFLCDPFCYLAGARTRSLLRQIEQGDLRPFWRLLAAGLICGGLWEGWNFWAYTKWLYTVPHLEELKWFEMPPLGFLGFPPFALECYALINLLNAARRGRGWEGSHGTGRGAPANVALSAIIIATLFNGAMFAGIDMFTVKSIAPTLMEIDGVQPQTIVALQRAGISTPPAFLRRVASPERLAELAKKSGVEPDQLAALRRAAQLVNLEGLGAVNYNALRRLGIAGVEDLAAQDPAILFPRWRAAATERPPTLPQVRLWVRSARRAMRQPV